MKKMSFNGCKAIEKTFLVHEAAEKEAECYNRLSKLNITPRIFQGLQKTDKGTSLVIEYITNEKNYIETMENWFKVVVQLFSVTRINSL